MTVTQAPWVWIVVLSLALFGAWFLATRARDGVRDLREWWQAWPAVEDARDAEEISEECARGDHGGCEGCWCECGHDLEELPPERTREELGFTGPPPLLKPLIDAGLYRWHEPARERRAPWWEAEHRAAYESLGFDYPSGLMARVREAAP